MFNIDHYKYTMCSMRFGRMTTSSQGTNNVHTNNQQHKYTLRHLRLGNPGIILQGNASHFYKLDLSTYMVCLKEFWNTDAIFPVTNTILANNQLHKNPKCHLGLTNLETIWPSTSSQFHKLDHT